ncbi:MAG: tripartite tricarboxylate transporter substrate binding protein, partial [Burkholderiales bacterium]|nr:tripartite tricarboxylate transporter substrate binding protein [Burkholderiales bacterium]
MHPAARTICLFAAGLWAAGLSKPAPAQAFPARPVHVTITIPAGGAADVILRVAAPKINEGLGQPLVLENKPAMSGVLASEQLVKMAPEGYNLLFTTPSSQITVKFLSKNVRYDPEKDFTPITAFVEPVSTLVVGAAVPVASLKELIEYARKHPGKLAYASAGVGSVFHLTTEAQLQATQLKMRHVPYKGAGPALNDLLGGQVNVMFDVLGSSLPHIQGGKLVPLAVTS